jgi:F-type H+-transporting ATPase subunit delta
MALSGSIARRYARALLEIGIAKQAYEQMGRELETVARLVHDSRDLQHALDNPIFPLSQRKGVLDQLATKLGVHKEVRNFLMLVMDRGRIAQLGDMARELSALVDQQAGRVRATVIAAQPIDAAFAQSLRGAIEKRLGKQVILEQKADPALIGGVVTKVGDILYDGSIKTQLELARQQLLTE